jgi:hypothetical protein
VSLTPCPYGRRAVLRPSEGPLWVSRQAERLSYTGLVRTLKSRAADAGVIGFQVHRLRHTMALRWLRAGGSETGLRAQAGWTDNAMVACYVQDRQRAAGRRGVRPPRHGRRRALSRDGASSTVWNRTLARWRTPRAAAGFSDRCTTDSLKNTL